MCRPLANRHSLRARTAPPGLQALKLQAAPQAQLQLPESPAVQRQLAESSPAATHLDVALGILERLSAVPGNDLEELLFLRGCLKVERSQLALPCSRAAARDLEGSLHSGCGTPASQVSDGAYAFQLSDPEEDEAAVAIYQDHEEVVSRWPAAGLDSAVALELEELFQAGFDTWAFDSFSLARLTAGRPLQFAGWEALRRSHLFADFNLEPSKVKCFLRHAESKYGSAAAIPYHNSMHAADVTQSVHALLGDVGFSAYLDPLSCLTLVLGAVIHDMGHDGRSNVFHVNAGDQLALTYNDTSVLENYHASLAFKLLAEEPEANLLSGFEREQFARLRKQMVDAVLSTDMAQHFNKLGSLKSFEQRLNSHPDAWRGDAEAAASLRSLVLHAADISNPAKPARLADQWLELLTQEFFQQGDEEKHRRMPVSMLCDRDATRSASSQLGFIRFVVQPTFELLAGVVPRVETVVLTELHVNADLWAQRQAEEEELRQARPRLQLPCSSPGPEA